jgi:signal transduction histidine kinase
MLSRADEICARWELGATLYDMQLAGDQAEHSVAAMRSLGNRRAERAPGLDINDSLRAALALTRTSHKRLSLALELDTAAGTLHGHLGELVQIWTNLIRNACEALAAAQPPKPLLTVRSRREGDFLIVTITDNGPGIPADILPLLFQPHVSSRQGGAHNLGLGLSIVKQLVDSYGGSIEAQTAPGGTTFTVRLPVRPAA